MGTQLISLTYSFVLLVIALEMADIETPSCRATSHFEKITSSNHPVSQGLFTWMRPVEGGFAGNRVSEDGIQSSSMVPVQHPFHSQQLGVE
ncbi:MAG: hypothetical protein LWX01_08480 [Deltaproteobacteria bacterium]|nr:hypothetical protein [Deltaproteobacteria bacterium]MDL1961718.1 hypothetical protein [Deltaproteobacteria bacterium]